MVRRSDLDPGDATAARDAALDMLARRDRASGQIFTKLTGHGYLPEVAAWLGRAAETDGDARKVARVLRARGDAAVRRGRSDAASGVAASALDEATFYLRAVGLTWREIGVLHEIEKLQAEQKSVERSELAARLHLSPETLRVHITRIRAKLDVGDRRGDTVLLEAALAQRPVA